MGAADPRVTGDWDGYFAARSEALLPLSDERDRVRRELGQIEQSNSPGDIARAEELAYRERVLSANMETTTPSFLSRSGDFEPGDLEGYARAQGIDAMQLGRESRGLPRLDAEAADRAYDEQMAALSPEARRAAVLEQEPAYRSARANEVAAENLRQRVPGATGEALAEAAMLGMLSGPIGGGGGGGRSARPASSPAPRVSGGASCSSCGPGAAPAASPAPAAPAEGGGAPRGLGRRRMRQFGDASLQSRVLDGGDSVYKRVGNPDDFLRVDGGRSSVDERNATTRRMVEVHNQVSRDLGGDIVPPLEQLQHPDGRSSSWVRQARVDGTSYYDLAPGARARADYEMGVLTGRANDALGLDMTRPMGQQWGAYYNVDTNPANFRFTPEGGVRTWFDPVVVSGDTRPGMGLVDNAGRPMTFSSRPTLGGGIPAPSWTEGPTVQLPRGAVDQSTVPIPRPW